MKNRLLLLAALTAALSACGSQPTTTLPPTPAPIGSAEADDDETLASDTFVFEAAPRVGAQRLGAQADPSPLTVTVSVVRARSGKFKGYTRARAVFMNTSGATLKGAVHVELAPADGGPVTAPAYDSAKISLNAAKKTVQTVYDSPTGRQCARVSFDLMAADGAAIRAPRDVPVTVCDLADADLGHQVIYSEFAKAGAVWWPMVRVTLQRGTEMVPGGLEYQYWPEMTTPPTLDQVRGKLRGYLDQTGSTFGISLMNQAEGNFTSAQNWATTYGGGSDAPKFNDFQYIYRNWKRTDVTKNNTKWKKVFKTLSYYSSAGNRAFLFEFTPTRNLDNLKETPGVAVMTGSGPLGTFAIIGNSKASGANRLDGYFNGLNTSQVPPPPASVDDVQVYGYFDDDSPRAGFYLANLNGTITASGLSYSAGPLQYCGASTDGPAVASGPLRAEADEAQRFRTPALSGLEAGRDGVTLTGTLTDGNGDTRSLNERACFGQGPMAG